MNGKAKGLSKVYGLDHILLWRVKLLCIMLSIHVSAIKLSVYVYCKNLKACCIRIINKIKDSTVYCRQVEYLTFY